MDEHPRAAGDAQPPITVFWRRGCGYCMALRRSLRNAGLETREVDIWADPEGAAFVRAHAHGTETVPTVAIGGTVLVNPPARTVLALAEEAGLWTRPPQRPAAHRFGWRR